MADHPKEENEEVFDAAIREFKDETGMRPNGPYIDLDNIIQKNGKLWTFPEIDQAIMMNAKEAKKKLRAEQKPLIDRLLTYLTEQDIKTNH